MKKDDPNKDIKPVLIGGIGEINFGKQYRQGNRIYDADAIAMALTANPVGNAGGYTYLYLVREEDPCRAARCGWYSNGACTCSSLELWYQCPFEPEPDWDAIFPTDPE